MWLVEGEWCADALTKAGAILPAFKSLPLRQNSGTWLAQLTRGGPASGTIRRIAALLSEVRGLAIVLTTESRT